MGKFMDLTGMVFSKLTAIKRMPNTAGGRAVWMCKCECGNDTYVTTAHHLKSGNTRSCGCMFNKGGTKHGLSVAKSPEYEAWRAMKRRCVASNKVSKKDYYDRGISVCEEWRDNFEAFYSYTGLRPSDAHSLGRIDNDKGYEHGNVRWELIETQSRNKRSNVFISYNGSKMILADFSKLIGVQKDRIRYHLKKGRSIEYICALPKSPT